MAKDMSAIASTLSRREKAREDDLAAASAKGTLNSLRLREENLMFLARMCNRYNVQLCQGAVGRVFYTRLKKLNVLGADAPERPLRGHVRGVHGNGRHMLLLHVKALRNCGPASVVGSGAFRLRPKGLENN